MTMTYLPFMFNCGSNTNGRLSFVFNGKTLNLSDEDLVNFKQNGLDDETVKVISFSYLTKLFFADFSSNLDPIKAKIEGSYEL